MVRAVATMPRRWPVEVLLALPPEEVRRRVPAAYGTLEPAAGGTTWRCQDDDLDGVARFLIGLGCRLRVHQPPQLREALRRIAREIATVTDGA